MGKPTADELACRRCGTISSRRSSGAIWTLIGRMDLRGFYQSIESTAEEGGRPAFDPQLMPFPQLQSNSPTGFFTASFVKDGPLFPFSADEETRFSRGLGVKCC